ncbi:hypothetical protein COI44_02000 [Bacillus sp. AFS088145]|nr:hypothetical protein COI44_02000 [Bacillus sp. AFS088145]
MKWYLYFELGKIGFKGTFHDYVTNRTNEFIPIRWVRYYSKIMSKTSPKARSFFGPKQELVMRCKTENDMENGAKTSNILAFHFCCIYWVFRFIRFNLLLFYIIQSVNLDHVLTLDELTQVYER